MTRSDVPRPTPPAETAGATVSPTPAALPSPADPRKPAPPSGRSPGPGAVAVSYQTSFRELIGAVAWMARRMPTSRVFMAGLALIALALLGASFMQGGPAAKGGGALVDAVGAGLLAVAWGTGAVSAALFAILAWPRRRTTTIELRFEADDNGFRISSTLGRSRATWDLLDSVRASDRHYYLRRQRGGLMIVPRRAFSERQARRFGALLSAHGLVPPG